MANVFIIDIDHTLLNTDFYQPLRNKLIREACGVSQEAIDTALQTLKQRDSRYTLRQLVEHFTAMLPNGEAKAEKIIQMLYHTDFSQYYYEGVENSLEILQHYGTNIIFSQGEPDFQKQKVAKLVALGLISPEAVFVYTDKTAEIPGFLERFPNEAIFVIDDHQSYLYAFKQAKPAVQTVLVTTQEQPGQAANALAFWPDMVAKNFASAVEEIEERLKA